MKKTVIIPHIYLVHFSTGMELTSTFLRFQEHYESPQFGGKIFTRKEYADWYREKHGTFSYLTDWDGFNIPSWVLIPFYRGHFKRLTKLEKALLEVFRVHWKSGEQFYIIGTAGDSTEKTLDHEIAHGLYSIRPKYRKAVDNILGRRKFLDVRALLVRDGGYAEHVFQDEIHAYLGHSVDYLAEQDIDTKKYADTTRRLKRLFRTHYDRRKTL